MLRQGARGASLAVLPHTAKECNRKEQTSPSKEPVSATKDAKVQKVAKEVAQSEISSRSSVDEDANLTWFR